MHCIQNLLFCPEASHFNDAQQWHFHQPFEYLADSMAHVCLWLLFCTSQSNDAETNVMPCFLFPFQLQEHNAVTKLLLLLSLFDGFSFLHFLFRVCLHSLIGVFQVGLSFPLVIVTAIWRQRIWLGREHQCCLCSLCAAFKLQLWAGWNKQNSS